MTDLDRIVLIINDMTIKGNTRMQKYGFLIHQLYSDDLDDLNFYSDWKAYHYGPFSESLADDLSKCVEQKLVTKFSTPTNNGRTFTNYSLTIKGRMRLRQLSTTNHNLIKILYEKFTQLNKKSMASILKDIYIAYPEYTVNSEIKEQVMSD